jgi:AraC-like DNA-binding protein
MPVSTLARPLVDPFQAWLERCRTELLEQRCARDAAGVLQVLASEMPRAFTRAQRESAQGVLTRLVCRAASQRPPSEGLTSRLLFLLARDYDEHWRDDWSAMVGAVLVSNHPEAHQSTDRSTTADPRVERALGEIERRYADPDFLLRHVASELAVSACRLTQLLKAETGSTFGAHVRRRRIALACVLLDEPAISIKEIACRVGYQTTTQLGRQFKRHTSLLPSVYRQSIARPRPLGSLGSRTGRPSTPTLLPTKQQN